TASATVMAFNPPPILTAPVSVTVRPGDTVDFTVTAEDPHAPIVYWSTNIYQFPPEDHATFTLNATNTEGHFTRPPRPEDFVDDTDYILEFLASDGGDYGSGSTYTLIYLRMGDLDHLDANRLDLLVSNEGVVGRDTDFGGPGLFFPKGSPHTVMF